MNKLLVVILLGIACAAATLYAQEKSYRVVSSYGAIAIVSFTQNDTVSEGGVTKFKHWVQITPLRLPLWVFLDCNRRAYKESAIDQAIGRNKDGSWITKRVITPDACSVNRPQAFYMTDSSPNAYWDIDWCIYDELGNEQNIIPVQYQKILDKGVGEATHNDENAQKETEDLNKFKEQTEKQIHRESETSKDQNAQDIEDLNKFKEQTQKWLEEH